jgi:eukaryotic-like serine/threonine-protein kinase
MPVSPGNENDTMTHEAFGWSRVAEMCGAALSQSPHERDAFLTRACEGDPVLRREVESLLAQEARADRFLSASALEMAAHTAVTGSHGSRIGERVGPYEITGLIGAGGMGEVYRARDTKLGRDVAIKIVPRVFASDRDRVARFDREARVLALLNHPHIGAIYGLDAVESTPALVLELVDGDTLAERIARGPLSLADTLTIAKQIAEALEAAHERGIVHRDLKPANIKITAAGVVKVLDFGLAKAAAGDASSPDLTHPPILTVGGTRDGIVLGTAAYMSPEQARGQAVDKRTDIWAFGCVLYEMMTGRRAFDGATASNAISTILQRDPDWRALPGRTPIAVRRLLRRCLEKDARRRLHDIADARLELDDPGEHPLQTAISQIARMLKRPRVAISTVLILAAAAIGGVLSWRPAPALTGRDAILLADVANITGDPLFDGTLTQALSVKLEESPFLNVAPDDGVQKTLRLMGRPPDARVTSALGREICQRQGLKVMVTGSIASLGAQYVVTLKAINCQSGDTIARVQAQAGSREEVLHVIGNATTSLRGRLGESLASIRKFDTPLEEASTSSLEALKAYTLGRSLLAVGGGRAQEAIPSLKRAIELDPNFAYAYYMLSVAYSNLSEQTLIVEYAARAYEHRARVTERERLSIMARYHQFVTGDLLKQFETLSLLRQTYPQEEDALNTLGGYYNVVGQFERAAEAYREEVRLRPDNAIFVFNLASAYINLNRLDEAKTVLDQAVTQKLESPLIHQGLWRIASIQSDRGEADRELQWLLQRVPGMAFAFQTQMAGSAGKLHDMRTFATRQADVNTRVGLSEAAALGLDDVALIEAVCSDRDDARRDVATALKLAPTSREVARQAAVALAIGRMAKEAHALLDHTLRAYPPTHTLATAVYIPAIRAALDLAKGSAAAAIGELQAAAPYESNLLLIMYLRASAYLAANQLADAAVEFEKLIDRLRSVPFSPYTPLAELGLGRALARQGDLDRSRTAYQDFFAAWKDADPGIPILAAAKQEYARLDPDR